MHLGKLSVLPGRLGRPLCEPPPLQPAAAVVVVVVAAAGCWPPRVFLVALQSFDLCALFQTSAVLVRQISVSHARTRNLSLRLAAQKATNQADVFGFV